jgi:hypothetical protein
MLTSDNTYIYKYNVYIYTSWQTIKNKTPRSHTAQIGTDKPWTPVLLWLSSERSAPGTHGTHGTPQVDDLLGMFFANVW